MITRQLNIKLLLQLSNQRSKTPKNLHSLRNDHQLFDQSPQPDSASIRTSMLYHLRQNRHREALRIFKSELRIGLRCKNIDNAVITLALKACRSEPRLGREIHGYAVSSGFIRFPTVSNSLMNMYSKSGKFDSALCVFKGLSDPCVVAWNTILSGFRKSEEALSFALRMNCNGVEFDPVSYTTILGFCSEREEFLFGIQLHCLVLKSGLDCELFVGNALISFYSRCNCLPDARKVFDEMRSRDLVTWNAILSGYTQGEDHGSEAISIFVAMARERKDLDHISFTSAVSACGHERNLELGKQIHGSAIKSGYGNHLSVCNVLMSTYSKTKAIEDAKLVFWDMKERNVVSWTSIISIDEENAVLLFRKMRSSGVTPNEVTFIGLLHAITTKNSILEGQTVHGFSVKAGFLSEIHVCNSLITMYAKFDSSMEDCSKLFDEICFSRDITSWNCMISGYTQNEFYRKALETFLSATTEFQPNHYTFGSALGAIADSEDISLEHGQRIHSRLIKLGLDGHEILSGALLDMYAKRGSIAESRRVFDETNPEKKTRFAWTAMISGYAAHGDQVSTTRLFREMVEEKQVKPDSVTFLSVLTACSRKGMVEEGQKIFDSMVEEHGIEPGREHYTCMVDMYGRAGRVELAEEMARRVPGGPGLSGLQSLLGACLVHKDEAEIGERAVRALMDLGPNESGPYVLASNMFAERGDWESVAMIRKGMRRRGVKKVVGLSRADVGGPAGLHGFSANDKSHPKSDEIFVMARCLGCDMKSLSEGLILDLCSSSGLDV